MEELSINPPQRSKSPKPKHNRDSFEDDDYDESSFDEEEEFPIHHSGVSNPEMDELNYSEVQNETNDFNDSNNEAYGDFEEIAPNRNDDTMDSSIQKSKTILLEERKHHSQDNKENVQEVSLLFDPLFQCYYDPKSNKYFLAK